MLAQTQPVCPKSMKCTLSSPVYCQLMLNVDMCFLQSPATPPAQLTKCDVRREYDSTRPKAVKYVLRLSDIAGASTFMMSALQVSR